MTKRWGKLRNVGAERKSNRLTLTRMHEQAQTGAHTGPTSLDQTPLQSREKGRWGLEQDIFRRGKGGGKWPYENKLSSYDWVPKPLLRYKKINLVRRSRNPPNHRYCMRRFARSGQNKPTRKHTYSQHTVLPLKSYYFSC